MLPDEEQIKSIELMAQNEHWVAELYRLYAVNFPDRADFWNKLAMEEDGHAKILRGFIAGLMKNELTSRERVFPSSVLASIAFIKNKITEVQTKEITLIEALKIADGIETSLLEKSYFKVVAGDGPSFKSGLIRLAQDTQRHHSMITQLLDEFDPGHIHHAKDASNPQ